MSTQELTPTTIRLPKPLRAKLRAIAKREGRSLTKQAQLFLELAVLRHNTAEEPTRTAVQ